MATQQTEPAARPSVVHRLHRAIGPIAGGLILDAADFLTFGPLGLYAGAVVGAAVGLWVTGIYRFSVPVRCFWALMAAIYCTVPMTEPLPIATAISAVARYFDDPLAAPDPDDGDRAAPD